MTATDQVSHRERKRARTWTAIHLAAANAAATHDHLSDITIESIADAAYVSPRTFFNYFKSKEDAVLGLRAAVISDTVVDEFLIEPGDDLVEKVAFLLLTVFRTTNHKQITQTEYADLMERHPELARRRFRYIDDVQALVAEFVTERLVASDGWTSAHPDESPEEAAQMVVTVAGAVMRAAMRPILTRADLEGTDADAILHRKCAQFRSVTRP
ncbi:TetR family transcriptional regulator [Rhodococcus sp. SMB37]|uniref:TetR/AcrR family transcriptional regulator n=1 Tax=Rhodococcus sp. SMB37 TaxID=2512213 RepID=UPI0006D0CF2B|nr:TetR/AcrR family transcriptional regulator [Rhodococcus sp. SMB37]TCN52310.1 TetR family transcriptional regulator [Rhodococcus sp. SMB37]